MRAALLVAALLVTASLTALAAKLDADHAAGDEGPAAGGTTAVKPLAGCDGNSLGATDDGGAGPVALPFTLDLFGVSYDALYVNNNGNVTFDSPLPSFAAVELSSLGRVIIAPFFADVDTQGAGSGSSRTVTGPSMAALRSASTGSTSATTTTRRTSSTASSSSSSIALTLPPATSTSS